MQIKKTAVTVATDKAESDMSSGRGKINRQNAIDLQDGDDHVKEDERKKCVGERRKENIEGDPSQIRQQFINSQAAEGSTPDASSAADSSFIQCNSQQTRNALRHKLT